MEIVTNNSTVTANGGDAIIAVNDGGLGGAVFETSGTIYGSNNGITVSNKAAGVTEVLADGDVTGQSGVGIFATSGAAAEALAIAVTDFGSVYGGTYGIQADSASAGGSEIEIFGDVTSGGTAIAANQSGVGNLEITTAGTTYGQTNGIVAAQTGTGRLTITAGGTTTGLTGNAIEATATAGDMTVKVIGEAYGGTYGINTDQGTYKTKINIMEGAKLTGVNAAVNASSTGGRLTIQNYGTAIGGIGGTNYSDVAVMASGGPVILVNADEYSFLGGRIMLTDQADSFENEGKWVQSGISDFGAGEDEVENTGIIITGDTIAPVAAVNTYLVGLEEIKNAGVITMQNQYAGGGAQVSDKFVTDGEFVGAGGTLAVDAYLSAVGGTSDILVADKISGTTTLIVNDTSIAPGGLDLSGIVVVDGLTGSSANAVTMAQPVDKGLFAYDVAYNKETFDHVLVGVPDREVFEIGDIVGAGAAVFNTGNNVWARNGQQGANPGATEFWTSGVYDYASVNSDHSFEVLNSELTTNTDHSRSVMGFLAGADYAYDAGGNGDAIQVGVMGGYLSSKQTWADGNNAVAQGPTYGMRAGYASDDLLVQASIKRDDLNVDYRGNSLTAYGEDSANFGMSTTGGALQVAYAFYQSPTSKFEMTSDLGMSYTSIDDFTLQGVDFGGSSTNVNGAIGMRWSGSYGRDVQFSPAFGFKLGGDFGSGKLGLSSIGGEFETAIDAGGIRAEIDASMMLTDPDAGWYGYAATTAALSQGGYSVGGEVGAKVSF